VLEGHGVGVVEVGDDLYGVVAGGHVGEGGVGDEDDYLPVAVVGAPGPVAVLTVDGGRKVGI
jgi:hypothetical protein